MRPPRATYRLQLHAGFGLRDVLDRVPYLSDLGVSHVYLSPILRARRESAHGYDVVDPTRLDPELGTETDLEALAHALAARDMGIVLDIVPNHMATGAENPFWQDVLTHGRCARFAHWFDIDWRGDRSGKVFLPVLGDLLPRVLDRNEISVSYAGGRFTVRYFEHIFPVDPATVPMLFDAVLPPSAEGDGFDALRDTLQRLRRLPSRDRADAHAASHRREEASAALRDLQRVGGTWPDVARTVEYAIATVNAPGRPELRALLDAQAYRLAYWRRAAREINYRRFFTISHLVAVRVEDPDVFDATHRLVLDWVARGWIHGLRIDHIDGVAAPSEYLARLRAALRNRLPDGGDAFPIYVEKILSRDEALPAAWPVSGTTGYEFLNELEDLFLDEAGAQAIDEWFRGWTGQREHFGSVARSAKRLILAGHMVADVRRAAHLLATALRDRGPVVREPRLAEAIIESIAHLPVYRTYLDDVPEPRPDEDRARLGAAIEAASAEGRADGRALVAVRHALTATDARASRRTFVRRYQQLSGPAAAKGVEDTAFYRYVALLARNEVGGEPAHGLGRAVEGFHAAAARRLAHHPTGMGCVTTHDTKRSSGVRARLAVLTQLADDWTRIVERWHRLNRPHRTRVRGRLRPERHVEYQCYQTLVGVWPVGGIPSAEAVQHTADRLAAYMEKAIREAKQRTSWVAPHPAYEDAVRAFARGILADPRGLFAQEIHDLATRVARVAILETLARTLIHLTAAGVPDIYQGDELDRLLIVDPDNRRPVSFDEREERLSEIVTSPDWGQHERDRWIERSLAEPRGDALKLWVTYHALALRRREPDLFQDASYVPLVIDAGADIVAFARRRPGRSVITVTGRRLAQSVAAERPSEGAGAPGRSYDTTTWRHTAIPLPPELAGRWRCVLGGHEVTTRAGGLEVSQVLSRLPVALLVPV